MWMALDDLLAVRDAVAGVKAFPLDGAKWSIGDVSKSWSHYKTLDKFTPSCCVELGHYQGEYEWHFLISPFFDAGDCSANESAVWRAAGALAVVRTGGTLYVLNIAGCAPA